MKLSAETLSRVEEIFEALLAMAPSPQQDSEALRLSLGDPDLASQALSLARAHHRREALNAAVPAPDAGRTFGRYRTIQRIGSGGMGTVYLAERADGEYRQTVAVKVIHTYLTGDAFYKRFLEERQILAAMHHPNITKILDGGVTEEGAPYLVMEHIAGLPLDLYCRDNHLTLRQRLQLFRRVCEPVAYAHRNLVVHRDLKPSNVIVNSEGTPVLLDFGTAKFLETVPSTDLTAFPFLTLRYSSPEQRRRGAITTGTDVFSLGVILYELLTEAWPFGDASSPEALLKSFGSDSTMVPPQVPADIASILSKALASEPERRYESVQAFSADIDNWLLGMPVTAKPHSFADQALKFARRHAVPIALAALAFVSLLTAAGVALYQAQLARDRYQEIRTLTTGLLFELKDAIYDVPGSTAAQQILADRVLRNLASLTHASSDPDLQLELAEAYRQLGELQGDPYSQNLGNSKAALVTLEKGRAIVESAFSRKSLNTAWLHEAGLLEITTAEVAFGAGQTENAILHATRSMEYYERLVRQTTNAGWIADASAASGVFGDFLGQQGTASRANPAEATRRYRRAVELDEKALALKPNAVRPIRGIAMYRMKIGDLLRPTNPVRALDDFRAAAKALTELPPAEQNLIATKRLQIYLSRKTGNALRDLQQWQQSEDLLKQVRIFSDQQVALDPNDKRALTTLAAIISDQVALYSWHQDYPKLLQSARSADTVLEALLRQEPDNKVWRVNLAFNRYELSLAQAHQGHRDQADKLAKDAFSQLQRLAESPGAPPLYFELAAEAMLEQQPAQAIIYARRYLAATNTDNVNGLYLLALALQAAGRHAEAVTTAQTAFGLLAPQNDDRVPYKKMRLQKLIRQGAQTSSTR